MTYVELYKNPLDGREIMPGDHAVRIPSYGIWAVFHEEPSDGSIKSPRAQLCACDPQPNLVGWEHLSPKELILLFDRNGCPWQLHDKECPAHVTRVAGFPLNSRVVNGMMVINQRQSISGQVLGEVLSRRPLPGWYVSRSDVDAHLNVKSYLHTGIV